MSTLLHRTTLRIASGQLVAEALPKRASYEVSGITPLVSSCTWPVGWGREGENYGDAALNRIEDVQMITQENLALESVRFIRAGFGAAKGGRHG